LKTKCGYLSYATNHYQDIFFVALVFYSILYLRVEMSKILPALTRDISPLLIKDFLSRHTCLYSSSQYLWFNIDQRFIACFP